MTEEERKKCRDKYKNQYLPFKCNACTEVSKCINERHLEKMTTD